MTSQGFTDTMTQAQVEGEIERLAVALERETEKLATLGMDMGRAEIEHKKARAKAFLKAEGTVDGRNATVEADDEVMDLLFERRRTEVMYEAQREKLRTMRTQIDALRSINVNVREQV
jgi:hypothetical protein